MIFQSALTERILVVAIAQTWPIIFLSVFAYKLLKRARNRSTITLSTFFLLVATAYLIAIFSILSVNSPFSYALYITSWYILMFSHGLLILFSFLLLKIEKNISFIKYVIFIMFYGVITTYIFWIGIFYNGIRYDISTGWRPIFSNIFLLANWIYLVFFIIIPEIIMAVKLVNLFKGSNVVIRIKLFLLSTFLEYVAMILLVLYNMLPENHPYRLIHLFIGSPLGLVAAYLIYRSFGKNIE